VSGYQNYGSVLERASAPRLWARGGTDGRLCYVLFFYLRRQRTINKQLWTDVIVRPKKKKSHNPKHTRQPLYDTKRHSPTQKLHPAKKKAKVRKRLAFAPLYSSFLKAESQNGKVNSFQDQTKASKGVSSNHWGSELTQYDVPCFPMLYVHLLLTFSIGCGQGQHDDCAVQIERGSRQGQSELA
jgi:hypothetical protein